MRLRHVGGGLRDVGVGGPPGDAAPPVQAIAASATRPGTTSTKAQRGELRKEWRSPEDTPERKGRMEARFLNGCKFKLAIFFFFNGKM